MAIDMQFLTLRRKLCVFIITNAFVLSVSAYADVVNSQSALDAATGWIVLQQNHDGSWGADTNTRFGTTAAVVNALGSSYKYSRSYYDGVAWIENNKATNADFISQRIYLFSKRGSNTLQDLIDLLAISKDYQAGWGLNGSYEGSAIDTAIALEALLASGEATGQTEAINFLISTQKADGAWPLNSGLTSDYWVTGKVAASLERIQSPSVEVTAAINNAVLYLTSIPLSDSTQSLSQAVMALYGGQGESAALTALTTELLQRQSVEDNWGDVYTTALVIQALSTVLGNNEDSYNVRVEVTDQTLRALINDSLGKNAYDNLVQGELVQIISLDLRSADVQNLNGLENASNLIEIKVNANTDISAISGLGNVTVFIDTDVDDVADASDNCPSVPNTDQGNLDGDAFGDLCDDDIDGDGFTVVQGDIDDYDPSIYPGSVVRNGDVNGDSVVDIADMLLMQQRMLGLITLDSNGITRGDLYPQGTGDGVINIQDYILLLQLMY